MPEEINGNTPASDINQQPTQETTPEVTPGNDQSVDTLPKEEMFNGKPMSYWNNLEVEHARVKAGQSTLQKKLDRLASRGNGLNMSPEEYEAMNEWMQNPFSQQILQQEADRELGEGLKTIFEQYPNLNPQLKKAIEKNPRAYINDGTQTVADALLDIEEYLIEVTGEEEQTPSKPGEPAKNFPVAGNNGGVPASSNPEVNKLIEAVKRGGMTAINQIYQDFADRQIDKKVMEEFKQKAIELGLLH